MTIKKPNLAEGNEPEGHRQLDSHVETPPLIYGEPKGPVPGTLFQHSFATTPPDRERDGFFPGPNMVSKGDEVGGGPEDGERPKLEKSAEAPGGVGPDLEKADDKGLND